MMNDKELEIVKADLAAKGITNYSCYQGNNCIGVSYGRIACYYIIKDEKVLDIIFD